MSATTQVGTVRTAVRHALREPRTHEQAPLRKHVIAVWAGLILFCIGAWTGLGWMVVLAYRAFTA